MRCFPGPVPRSHKLYLSEIFTGEFQGVQIAVAGPMLGAPQTILVLERMIALGAARIIAVGWCGSLQKDVRIGDIVLPTGAVSEEGTSPHYPVESSGPSPDLHRLMAQSLRSQGLTMHEGVVWSIDAPFRETVEKVKKYRSEAVLSVDMETSALFAVSRFRGVEMSVVLVVSDDLSSLKWAHGLRDPAFRQSRQKVVATTLEAVCSAARNLIQPHLSGPRDCNS